MAGYSGTPLARKLGITKPGLIVALLQAPAGFRDLLDALPANVELTESIADGTVCDVVVFFTTRRADLESRLRLLRSVLQSNGGLWIAWPKKASRVPTDITEDVIREIALKKKLVDNKVCAIDETWSGLRLVIPVQFRPKKAKQR